MSERALYEVWNLENGRLQHWAAQMHGYVAHFRTEEAAVRYIDSVKLNRGEK